MHRTISLALFHRYTLTPVPFPSVGNIAPELLVRYSYQQWIGAGTVSPSCYPSLCFAHPSMSHALPPLPPPSVSPHRLHDTEMAQFPHRACTNSEAVRKLMSNKSIS